MRKIIILSYITLDGVMQAPGRADGDTSDDFQYGGWSAPYFYEADEAAVEFMVKYIKPADLLLGRKTFEAFAAFWPTYSLVTPNGVFFGNYTRAGEVMTGTVGA
jgi:dihydrofolate reductase